MRTKRLRRPVPTHWTLVMGHPEEHQDDEAACPPPACAYAIGAIEPSPHLRNLAGLSGSAGFSDLMVFRDEQIFTVSPMVLIRI